MGIPSFVLDLAMIYAAHIMLLTDLAFAAGVAYALMFNFRGMPPDEN